MITFPPIRKLLVVEVMCMWYGFLQLPEDPMIQLFFKRSTDDGASFGSVKKITDIVETFRPRIAASGNNVYIAFTDGSEDNMKSYSLQRAQTKVVAFSKAIGINNNDEYSLLGI